jgi:hypothetical protein
MNAGVPLIVAAVLLTIALIAVLAPAVEAQRGQDEPTWPGAPLSGRATRLVFESSPNPGFLGDAQRNDTQRESRRDD